MWRSEWSSTLRPCSVQAGTGSKCTTCACNFCHGCQQMHCEHQCPPRRSCRWVMSPAAA
jgi:hypothetical protein